MYIISNYLIAKVIKLGMLKIYMKMNLKNQELDLCRCKSWSILSHKIFSYEYEVEVLCICVYDIMMNVFTKEKRNQQLHTISGCPNAELTYYVS